MEHTVPLPLQFDENLDLGSDTGGRRGLPGALRLHRHLRQRDPEARLSGFGDADTARLEPAMKAQMTRQ